MRVAEEGSGNSDFVEQVHLDVYLQCLASFAQVVVNTVCTAIVDALNWHHSTAIAGYLSMNVVIFSRLVLSNMVQ